MDQIQFNIQHVITEAFFKFTYILLWASYNIIHHFYDIVYYLSFYVYTVLDLISNHDRIYSQINTLGQKPTHLTILMNLEDPSPQHLAQIIIWSIRTNVKYISFYDHKDKLKGCFKQLKSYADVMKHPSDIILWDFDRKNVEEMDHTMDEGWKGQRIYAKIMNLNDGKPTIAKLCRDFAYSVRNGTKKWDEIETADIEDGLKAHFVFPDPDLALLCGNPYSACHYPPWQIRVTELFQIQSHRMLTLTQFKHIMVDYSKVEQRYGK